MKKSPTSSSPPLWFHWIPLVGTVMALLGFLWRASSWVTHVDEGIAVVQGQIADLYKYLPNPPTPQQPSRTGWR